MIEIRSMSGADVVGVCFIEQSVMRTPWTAGQVESELSVDHGFQLVAERGGELAGYLFFRYCVPESELLRIAVSPLQQQKGVGKELLLAGIRELKGVSVTTCFLEVRRSNTTARSFYCHAGFKEIGSRPQYYLAPVEDAIQMSNLL